MQSGEGDSMNDEKVAEVRDGGMQSGEGDSMNDEKVAEVNDADDAPTRRQAPKSKKQASNMSFKHRLIDVWYQILECAFAPGCYYIGKDVADKMPLQRCQPRLSSVPVTILPSEASRIAILSEKKKSFGVDVSLMLHPGPAFGNSVVSHRVLGSMLYFFKPIPIEGSPVKIALGRRSFCENDTVVFDGTVPSEEHSVNVPNVNVPNYIASALRSAQFYSEQQERVACCLSSPYSSGEPIVKTEKTDNGDGTSKLKIDVSDSIVKALALLGRAPSPTCPACGGITIDEGPSNGRCKCVKTDKPAGEVK
jgi:hypothetical protein